MMKNNVDENETTIKKMLLDIQADIRIIKEFIKSFSFMEKSTNKMNILDFASGDVDVGDNKVEGVFKDGGKDDDMESIVSSVADLIESRIFVYGNRRTDAEDDVFGSCGGRARYVDLAKDEYRFLLSEWEDTDFSDDLIPQLFVAVCEWVEKNKLTFEPGTKMRSTIKHFKKRIDEQVSVETRSTKSVFSAPAEKRSIVSDFLIGKQSETICKFFGIVDGGCESLEAFLFRESGMMDV